MTLKSNLDIPDVAITARQALSVIESLATDDAFREQMGRDPSGAFARFNITFPKTHSLENVVLPSKPALQAGLEKIKQGKSWESVVGPTVDHPEGAFYAFLAFLAFLK